MTDILSKLAKAPSFRDMPLGLYTKFRDIAKSDKHILRRLTDEEFESLGIALDSSEGNWFSFDGKQICIRRRPCGQYVAFKI